MTTYIGLIDSINEISLKSSRRHSEQSMGLLIESKKKSDRTHYR